MAYNDISKNYTYENGGTIDGDLALTTMAANTKIKNKTSGQLYVKRSGYTNVFDKTNTYANYLKADEFGINTSGSGNGVASIAYSSSGRKITQNLTTFTTPSDLATANDNLKSQAVGSISVSGRTVTYKNVNGQTLGSFQTQDNNTTYSAGTGLSLSGTTFNVTSTAGNSNLQWNTEITLGTVGGFAIKAKLPQNPNTDTTYSANKGITLTGTTFGHSLEHSDDYYAYNGTARLFLSGNILHLTSNLITFDKYGHMLGLRGGEEYTVDLSELSFGGGSYNTWYVEGQTLKDSYSSSEIWSNLEHHNTSATPCTIVGSSEYWTLGGSHPVDGTYRCDVTGDGHFSKLCRSSNGEIVTRFFIEVTITKIA